jgi:uncharacterized protein (DUF924 family)
MSDAATILEFWFGPDETVSAEYRRRWFAADRAFDRLCVERFAVDYEAAVADQLEEWKHDPRSCLALVLLLDQFPRNLFRNTARAFATDGQALSAARGAIAEGFDRQLPPLQRGFFYLPFEHSERLADQDESVRLSAELAREHPVCADFLRYAESHREVIRRFGRFPLRNALLNRTSTLDEMAYLREHSGY